MLKIYNAIYALFLTFLARFSDGLPSFLDSATEIEEPVGTSTRGNSFSPRRTPLSSASVATQTRKDNEPPSERYYKLEEGLDKSILSTR